MTKTQIKRLIKELNYCYENKGIPEELYLETLELLINELKLLGLTIKDLYN